MSLFFQKKSSRKQLSTLMKYRMKLTGEFESSVSVLGGEICRKLFY